MQTETNLELGFVNTFFMLLNNKELFFFFLLLQILS